MSLDKFIDSNGNPYTSEENMRSDADQGKTCVFSFIDTKGNNQDFSIECLSVVEAIDNPREFDEIVLDIAPEATNSTAHECIISGQNLLACIVTQYTNLPTTIGHVIANLVLWDEDHSKKLDDLPVIFLERGMKELPKRLLCSSLQESQRVKFFTSSTSSFSETDKEWLNTTKMCLLCEGAYPFFNNKYGFLEFYRSIEVGYLSSVLKRFTDNLYKDAKQATKSAMESVSSEKNMLTAFVRTMDLKKYFLKIFKEIEHLQMGGNLYATALFEKSNKDTKNIPDGFTQQAWQGIVIVYQIRCSIAHAGSIGIVVEDYGDSDLVFEKINPIMEELVLVSLGFSF